MRIRGFIDCSPFASEEEVGGVAAVRHPRRRRPPGSRLRRCRLGRRRRLAHGHARLERVVRRLIAGRVAGLRDQFGKRTLHEVVAGERDALMG
ncbi:hypothetical protein FF950_20030, partial [Pseudoxanthomonas sp. X-1]